MTQTQSSATKPRLTIHTIENIAFGLLLVGAAIALAGTVSFAWDQERFNQAKVANTSLLGDMGSFLSGTVGIIWSLASVILFYLALREQRRDVDTNLKALDAQLTELKDTREVYKDQSTIFKTQGFENTFFQLLQLHSSTSKDISYSPDGSFRGPRRSGDVFTDWTAYLEQLAMGTRHDGGQDESGYLLNDTFSPYTTFNQIETDFAKDYTEKYEPFENALSHYFRQLYHIFKYVHMSPLIDDNRRKFYATLIRAQLSQNQLHVLLYNSLHSKYGKPKFLFLVKKYNILKNFNFAAIKQEIIVSYYNSELEKVRSPFKAPKP